MSKMIEEFAVGCEGCPNSAECSPYEKSGDEFNKLFAKFGHAQNKVTYNALRSEGVPVAADISYSVWGVRALVNVLRRIPDPQPHVEEYLEETCDDLALSGVCPHSETIDRELGRYAGKVTIISDVTS